MPTKKNWKTSLLGVLSFGLGILRFKKPQLADAIDTIVTVGIIPAIGWFARDKNNGADTPAPASN